jgi:hypothetical protein
MDFGENIKIEKKKYIYIYHKLKVKNLRDRRLSTKLVPTFAVRGVPRGPLRMPTAVISVF